MRHLSFFDGIANVSGLIIRSDFPVVTLAALMAQRYHISTAEITSAAAGLGKSGSVGKKVS
jgi:hypothetical protein